MAWLSLRLKNIQSFTGLPGGEVEDEKREEGERMEYMYVCVSKRLHLEGYNLTLPIILSK